MDRLLEGDELERLLDSDVFQELVRRVMQSRGAERLIDSFFASGLFDHFVEQLLASDGLWHLIDEIAGSPAVTAAVSQQGLGFADQVGEQVRTRSTRADAWLERAARRVAHPRSDSLPARPDPGTP